MELYILDPSFNPLDVIDSYSSLIWATRYYTAGDFELYLPASNKMMSLLKEDYFIKRPDKKQLMQIKRVQLETDAENGDFLIVSGVSTKKIVHQRIVWNQTNLSGKAEESIHRIINENVINPVTTQRKIPNFILGGLKGYTDTLTMQVTGDYVDTVVETICKQFKWGWDILFENGKLVFEVFTGQDNGVTFSKVFDNLIKSNYQRDKSNFANVALIAGEGEGINRRTSSINDTVSGLERYETFVDARDLSSNEGEITDDEYGYLLTQRGFEKLAEAAVIEKFDSEVEPEMTYHYGTDYDIGDIVTVTNEYGITAKSRIIEIIESKDETGYSVIPTFEEWSV